MVKKMSKKKEDISFIDPTTMQVRCTFNGCVDKFTVEDFEVFVTDNGKEFVSAFHACNECGQRVKAQGDGKRAYQKWLDVQSAKDPATLDPNTRMKLLMAGRLPLDDIDDNGEFNGTI
jgi:hypothetical protein